jgi:hypothetical protein
MFDAVAAVSLLRQHETHRNGSIADSSFLSTAAAIVSST